MTDQALAWGADDFTALEAVMWRAGANPTLSSNSVIVEQLDVAPDWERFRDAHEWGTRMAPRFRQRVVDGRTGLGRPTWVVDERFDLDRHVRRVALRDGGWDELLDRVARIAQAPFDERRPPWEATLVTGLPEGRVAYVLKLHHATLDGAAGMQLLGRLHSRTREPTDDKPQPPAPVAGTPRVLARQLRRDAGAAVGLLRRAPTLGRAAARADRTVHDAMAYAASLRRVLGDVDAEPSPLWSARDGRWRFQALDVRLPHLKAAARAADASLNDAYLAAVLGGVRRYHEEMGSPVDAIPVAIPVSTRRPDDPEGGNRFAGARLRGPVGIVDPVERMHEVGRTVRALRDEPALDALGTIAPGLARLPGPVVAGLAGRLTAANDLQASNIPGIRDETFIAGARVERCYAFGPLPGCAVMVVMVTHGDICCVTVNHDAAAISDPPRFRRCLADGFAEVLSLVPGAAPAAERR
ncbi:MAG: WS/DGAT domain-containing protein [Solirubrobacteraceae bacterium]|nr:WS/DGAT domain-containing protein [Solirubrobacteraceae bacterium]